MFYTTVDRPPCAMSYEAGIEDRRVFHSRVRDKLSLVRVEEMPRCLVLERFPIWRTMNESRVLLIVAFVIRSTCLSAQLGRRATYDEVGANLYRGGEFLGCSGSI